MAQTQATEGPGQALQAARKARRLSVAEVADRLKLSSAALSALEADDWDRLPAPVFVRGYVRAYARLMELDGEALLESRPNPVGGAAEEDSAKEKTATRGRGLFMWVGGAVAAVAAVIGSALSVFSDR